MTAVHISLIDESASSTAYPERAMSGNEVTTPKTPPMRSSRRRMPGARQSLACHRTVTTSDGVSLSVRDWGSHTAAHTVVLLHGFCLNKQSWDIQMAQLIRRWGNKVRIISYDHRGHGDSGNASMHTYRIDRLANDLAELLVALGVTGPLTLVGHSMGGMTALAYLRRPTSNRPVEPESLVLIATAAGNLGSHGLGRLLNTPATSMLYHLVHRMPRAGTDGIVQFLSRPVCAAVTRRGGYGEAAPKSLVAKSAATINTTPSTTKVGFLRGLKDYDCSHTLGFIVAKTTIISGGADKLTPMWHARELADGIPGATLIHRPTAGHTLLHEIPQVVTEAISSAIAAGGAALASVRSENPPAGDYHIDHCDSASKASSVEVDERAS
ncbi:alpha/beta fold hydrolase [Mycobacterium sp. E2479]|uniref:alpha/beta fold hydrolase n=1 Tax=Mycobacterium sp. E2479 TaxID=1834134 RepID=UPI0012EABA23|nr:alpha/beta hydrolase [Mycobacterium sp. E2479]